MSDSINHREFLEWVSENYSAAVAESCRQRLEKTPDDSPYRILDEVLDEKSFATAGAVGELADFRFNS